MQEGEQRSQLFAARPVIERPGAQIRRALELVIVSILLAFTVPLLLFVALAIKWESHGPILEKQLCIGRSGRRFELLNFRTTKREQTRGGWDREITRVGEFLRYTRIDALPQLINVLRGEMSILHVHASS
jgi:lipopolysaccharide/colanic/teichoic acid biosynthesis glycosyltransferase